MFDHFHVNCSCYDPEHELRFTYTEDGEFVIDYYLANHRNIFGRLWTAIRYVFNRSSRYGHFSETVVTCDEMMALSRFLVRNIQKWKNEQREKVD